MKKKRYKSLTLTAFLLFISLVFSSITVSAKSLTLSKGMSGSEVTKLQKSLKAMGFFNTSPTGYYGNQTKAAVIKLQNRYGLIADGIAGQSVFSVINKPNVQSAKKVVALSRGGSYPFSLRQRIIDTAKRYIGVPYVWGSANPSGFDSSGLIWYVFKQNGITLPRVSFDMYKQGTPISRDKLLPGDVVFFQGYTTGASHATIYAGDGNFIHSPSTGKTVSISRLFDDKYYWNSRFYGARRYIQGN